MSGVFFIKYDGTVSSPISVTTDESRMRSIILDIIPSIDSTGKDILTVTRGFSSEPLPGTIAAESGSGKLLCKDLALLCGFDLLFGGDMILVEGIWYRVSSSHFGDRSSLLLADVDDPNTLVAYNGTTSNDLEASRWTKGYDWHLMFGKEVELTHPSGLMMIEVHDSSFMSTATEIAVKEGDASTEEKIKFIDSLTRTKSVLDSYCALTVGEMVPGQDAIEIVKEEFRVSTKVLTDADRIDGLPSVRVPPSVADIAIGFGESSVAMPLAAEEVKVNLVQLKAINYGEKGAFKSNPVQIKLDKMPATLSKSSGEIVVVLQNLKKDKNNI